MKRLAGGESLIPELGDGEVDNEMNAREWEMHRAVAIKAGRDNARSRGKTLGLVGNGAVVS